MKLGQRLQCVRACACLCSRETERATGKTEGEGEGVKQEREVERREREDFSIEWKREDQRGVERQKKIDRTS